MKLFAFGRVFWILALLFVFIIPSAWARSTRRTSGKTGDRPVSDDASARRAPAQVAKAKKSTTPKRKVTTRRKKTRRARQVWTTSPYADSTAGDVVEGEDPLVRQAAVEALGPLNGSIVAVDPKSGRILAMVNQRVALGDGYIPCSTIKMPVALAALSEGVIEKETRVRLGRRWSMDLVEALAKSNNPFFEQLGRKMGFEKLSEYAQMFGFGELAGWNLEGEKLGEFPDHPAKAGVGRMCSFGDEISVTPLQLGAFVSAVANGGTLYYLQHPRTAGEAAAFEPRVKRQLTIREYLPPLREGMLAAVEYGTAKRVENPYGTVLGKTGTCSEGGTRLGWFASFESASDPKLALVVLLRGGRSTVGPKAAEVAGQVYRNLHQRNYYALRQEQQEQEPEPGAKPPLPATAIISR